MERFDKINGSRLYRLHMNIFTLTQGVSTVSAYYTRLKNFLDEYDSIYPHLDEIVTNLRSMWKKMQYQQLLQFPIGLNDNYSRRGDRF